MRRRRILPAAFALVCAAGGVASPVAAGDHAVALAGTHDCSSFAPSFAGIRTKWLARVTLGFDVDETGAPQNVRVLKHSGYDVMDDAAVECVKTRWRYSPRTEDGRPVAETGMKAVIEFTNEMSGGAR